jgi:hypothetical protein
MHYLVYASIWLVEGSELFDAGAGRQSPLTVWSNRRVQHHIYVSSYRDMFAFSDQPSSCSGLNWWWARCLPRICSSRVVALSADLRSCITVWKMRMNGVKGPWFFAFAFAFTFTFEFAFACCYQCSLFC